MPVGITEQRVAVRGPDDPCCRHVVRLQSTDRPAGGGAIGEQFEMWRFSARHHGYDIDNDLWQSVESGLRWSVIDRRVLHRQTECLVITAACAGVGDADCRVIDAEQSCSIPTASAARLKLWQFKRVALRVAELDGEDPSGRRGKLYWTPGRDRRCPESRGACPCRRRIGSDERQMLEAEVGAASGGWIGPPGLIEAIKIEALVAKAEPQPRAALLEAKQRDLLSRNRLVLVDREA